MLNKLKIVKITFQYPFHNFISYEKYEDSNYMKERTIHDVNDFTAVCGYVSYNNNDIQIKIRIKKCNGI